MAPGALYGAMAISASLAEGNGSIAVDDMQLHSPLVFSEKASENGTGEEGRRVQVSLDEGDRASVPQVQLFSRGADSEWTLHIEANVSLDAPAREAGSRLDLES